MAARLVTASRVGLEVQLRCPCWHMALRPCPPTPCGHAPQLEKRDGRRRARTGVGPCGRVIPRVRLHLPHRASPGTRAALMSGRPGLGAFLYFESIWHRERPSPSSRGRLFLHRGAVRSPRPPAREPGGVVTGPGEAHALAVCQFTWEINRESPGWGAASTKAETKGTQCWGDGRGQGAGACRRTSWRGLGLEGRGCVGTEGAAGTRAPGRLRAGSCPTSGLRPLRRAGAHALLGDSLSGGRTSPGGISTFSADRFAAGRGSRSQTGRGVASRIWGQREAQMPSPGPRQGGGVAAELLATQKASPLGQLLPFTLGTCPCGPVTTLSATEKEGWM